MTSTCSAAATGLPACTAMRGRIPFASLATTRVLAESDVFACLGDPLLNTVLEDAFKTGSDGVLGSGVAGFGGQTQCPTANRFKAGRRRLASFNDKRRPTGMPCLAAR